MGCIRCLLEIRPGPADRTLARSILDSRDRGPDVLAFILLRHANVDDLAAGNAMRDELGVAFLALFDQERVVIGDDLIESQGRLDAVLIQRGQYSENPNSIAIFVVAVATDIRKGRLVATPQAFRPAHGAHGQWRARGNLPVPVLKVYDDG